MKSKSNLEILQEIKEKKNYISLKYLEKICQKNKIPKSKIFGFLSFSEELFKKIDFQKDKE